MQSLAKCRGIPRVIGLRSSSAKPPPSVRPQGQPLPHPFVRQCQNGATDSSGGSMPSPIDRPRAQPPASQGILIRTASQEIKSRSRRWTVLHKLSPACGAIITRPISGPVGDDPDISGPDLLEKEKLEKVWVIFPPSLAYKGFRSYVLSSCQVQHFLWKPVSLNEKQLRHLDVRAARVRCTLAAILRCMLAVKEETFFSGANLHRHTTSKPICIGQSSSLTFLFFILVVVQELRVGWEAILAQVTEFLCPLWRNYLLLLSKFLPSLYCQPPPCTSFPLQASTRKACGPSLEYTI